MKKRLKFLWVCGTILALSAVLGKSFHVFKGHKKHRPSTNIAAVLEEKPFVIIIPSYNNSAFCERNLHSILNQHYRNYRIVYIDDCSTDDTCQKVQRIFEIYQPQVPIEFIQNKQNRGALANLYEVIHRCRNDEIIVTVDGDDLLAHEDVLSKLNKVYANPSVWMTYGNFLDYPHFTQKPVMCKKIPKKVVQNNSYRKKEWVSSHLRTFYAGLFKQVKLQDLMYKGSFLKMAWDLGFMMPMLEMSGKHAIFIKDILYLYNRSNPISDHLINFKFQEACAQHVRKSARYSRLKNIPVKSLENQSASLIVFSQEPRRLFSFLDSLEQNAFGIDAVSVIYEDAEGGNGSAFQEVAAAFPKTHLQLKQTDLKKQILDAIGSSNYVLFATDAEMLSEKMNIKECIDVMNKTSAYGFYLAKREGAPSSSVILERDIQAWQFKDGFNLWRKHQDFHLALYHAKDILKDLSKISFKDLQDLEEQWGRKAKPNKVGLHYTPGAAL